MATCTAAVLGRAMAEAGLTPFSDLLQRQPFVVLDGGLATELERAGEQLDDPLWSGKVLLEAPERVQQVHTDYLVAGADVVATASYQLTYPGLAARGFSRRDAEAVLRRSVEIALAARDTFWQNADRQRRAKPLVAASIGPYGAYLHDGSEYRGNYGLSVPELKEFHRDRLAVLADTAADLIAFESVPSFDEARAIVELLDEANHQPAWVSFTCCDSVHISDGHSFAQAVELVSRLDSVVAAGVNCTAPRFVSGLLESAAPLAHKPFVVYPNSGETYDGQSRKWQQSCDELGIASAARSWFALGARLIGGCCRTTPETVRAIRTEMSSVPA